MSNNEGALKLRCHPRETKFFYGHEQIEAQLGSLLKNGHLPSAILLTGEKGI